jgi:putative alpha-1,2-mannosidase
VIHVRVFGLLYRAAIARAGFVVSRTISLDDFAASDYVLGSPGLPAANITLPTMAQPVLIMIAHNWSPQAVFVANVLVNGVDFPTSYVEHNTLFANAAGGNVLEFVMSTTPVNRAV